METKNKQITPEIKARIFALYYNQQAVVTKGNYTHKINTTYLIDGDVLSSVGLGSLIKYRYAILVNPLSSITDEDLKDLATQVAEVSPSEYTSANMVAHKRYKQFIVSIKKEELELDVVDFLRSRGYALPAFGYSVEELVEAGVFKLREEQQ